MLTIGTLCCVNFCRFLPYFLGKFVSLMLRCKDKLEYLLLLTLGRKNIFITEIFEPNKTFNMLTQDRSERGTLLLLRYQVSRPHPSHFQCLKRLIVTRYIGSSYSVNSVHPVHTMRSEKCQLT